ncbi:hypothetical protein [Oleiharenicola lentus]|uniref:hypothetical protein n=1 Tax=Oleiharenicola lentus TaxID=2508720 RepID=UPI003F679D7A
MAFSSEITARLGLNTEKFHSGLTSAEARLRKFSADSQREAKGIGAAFEGLKKVLLAGGLVTAMSSFFRSAINYSREYQGEMDENVNATRRFGDSMARFEQTKAKAGTWVVGTMEKFGIALGSLFYGVDAASGALDEFSAESKKAFDDDIVRKRQAAEQALAKTRRDIAFGEGDELAKLVILHNEAADLKQQQAAFEKDSTEWIQKQIELEKNLAAQKKETDSLRKQHVEEIRLKEEQTNSQIATAEKERLARMEQLIARRSKLVEIAAAEAQVAEKAARVRNAPAVGASGVAGSDLDFELKTYAQDVYEMVNGVMTRVHAAGTPILDANGNVQPTNIRSARGGIGPGASFDRGAMFLLGGERTFGNPANQLGYEKDYRARTIDKINQEIAQLEREYQEVMRRVAYGGKTRTYMAPILLDRIDGLRNRRAHVDDYLFNPGYSDKLGRSIPGQQIEVAGGSLENYAKATASELSHIRRILSDKGIVVRNLSGAAQVARPDPG